MVALASSEDLFCDPFKVIVCAYFNYMDVATSSLQEALCYVCSAKKQEAVALSLNASLKVCKLSENARWRLICVRIGVFAQENNR